MEKPWLGFVFVWLYFLLLDLWLRLGVFLAGLVFVWLAVFLFYCFVLLDVMLLCTSK